MKKITLWIDETLDKEAFERAHEKQITKSELIRRALEWALRSANKPTQKA